VPVYASGGYPYPDNHIAALSEEIRHFVDLGFTHVKLKIGGAGLDHDLRRIEAAAAHLAGSERLAVDAMNAYDPGRSLTAAAATRTLAVELAPTRVNAVCPGVVRSRLWDSMSEASRDQLYRDTAASIPAGRVGEPDDIAQAYLYCLTQPFATGSILTVDGGTVLV